MISPVTWAIRTLMLRPSGEGNPGAGVGSSKVNCRSSAAAGSPIAADIRLYGKVRQLLCSRGGRFNVPIEHVRRPPDPRPMRPF